MMNARAYFSIGTALFLVTLIQAQIPVAFDAYQSGSTGADGVFDPQVTVVEADGILTTNITGIATGMVIRNATTNPRWDGLKFVDVQLNPSGVYHFSSIRIRRNYEVRFIPNAANTPVTFLSAGDIQLDKDAVIDVSAVATQKAMRDAGLASSNRTPGPGGYPGGSPAENGAGPLGGEGIVRNVSGISIVVDGKDAGPNPTSWPLMGGSGGGGVQKTVISDGNTIYAEGGGGGGVLYLAASGAIRLGYDYLSAANGNGNIDLEGDGGFSSGAAAKGGRGGRGAAALIASTIDRIEGGVIERVDPPFYLASLSGSGQRHLPPSAIGVFAQGFPSAWFNRVGAATMPEPQATGSQRIVHLPGGGNHVVGIATRRLPSGIVFKVSFRNAAGTKTLEFPPTVGDYNSSSTSSSYDFGVESSSTVISAQATAPINVAHAPVWRGRPLSELRIVLNPNKESNLEFVTSDGAVLSYEAGLALARQQGRNTFLVHPLL